MSRDLIALLFATVVMASATLPAEGQPSQPIIKQTAPTEKPFNSFTGRILKNKVRLRVQPALDAGVVREISRNDLLVVTGENEDFYAVLPPPGSKAYIFRTFVLDNVIEGSRVNVRLEPNAEAPIIAQLNTGDKVNGTVSPLNNKWLEIGMPLSVRYYVSKDYVEKIGDANLMATIAKKRDEVNQLLSNTYLISQDEMQKNFPDIKLDGITKNYNKIIDQSKDFPEQASRAKELLQSLQDNYIQRKIAYLESKAEGKPAPQPLMPQPEVISFEPAIKKDLISAKMAVWNENESAAFKEWEENHSGQTIDQFYEDQIATSNTLEGILEPYTKTIKNKPGDYVLLNQANHAIIAYLYSNKVNLADYAGQPITIKVAPRPNNHFAFPAYFVLEVTE